MRFKAPLEAQTHAQRLTGQSLKGAPALTEKKAVAVENRLRLDDLVQHGAGSKDRVLN